MDKAERKAKRICYNCNEIIMGGVIGVDVHFVTNAGKTRWYCDKCIRKLLRGE